MKNFLHLKQNYFHTNLTQRSLFKYVKSESILVHTLWNMSLYKYCVTMNWKLCIWSTQTMISHVPTSLIVKWVQVFSPTINLVMCSWHSTEEKDVLFNPSTSGAKVVSWSHENTRSIIIPSPFWAKAVKWATWEHNFKSKWTSDTHLTCGLIL